jgi:hypothetical protein
MSGEPCERMSLSVRMRRPSMTMPEPVASCGAARVHGLNGAGRLLGAAGQGGAGLHAGGDGADDPHEVYSGLQM